jgi:hypothetical protein
MTIRSMIPMNPRDRKIRQVFEAADFGPEVARKEAARLDAVGSGSTRTRSATV